MESVSVESKDEVLQRHRNEKKNMQCKIQSLKKSVAKGDRKRKKEVAEQIAEIEVKLNQKQFEELERLNNESVEDVFNSSLEKISLDDSTNKTSRAEKRRKKKITQLKEREATIQEHEIKNLGGARHKETQTLLQKLKNLGMSIYDIPSDGNCLYSAIVHQLKEVTGKIYTVPEIRMKTSDFLKNNKDDYIPYLSHPDTGNILTDEQFDDYCNQVANTAQWGGEVELRALSHIFNTPIKIVQAEGFDITIGIEYNDCNKPLILVFHRHMYGLGEHYNTVCLI
ncbi:deubiquitinase OTUD6B [Daktulosphaira vitifoliae]|uniref:deubiquitinase OTUD6B n=1 Tax=Daktulosphaira vitifoliae TaxID=58002 RepID=UPI0021AA12D2|nr:deubiquitinase OTUD6B [Daktulosphaira vitifoliae]